MKIYECIERMQFSAFIEINGLNRDFEISEIRIYGGNSSGIDLTYPIINFKVNWDVFGRNKVLPEELISEVDIELRKISMLAFQ